MGARQTIERRQLGLAIKRHRLRQGRAQHELAALLGHRDTRISKVEDGSATLSAEELDMVLDFLDIHGAERDTLVELGGTARTRKRRSRPRHSYTDNLPGSFQRLADMEADAAAIYSYEPGIIPVALQTPNYIRAVINSGNGVFWETSDAIVESRIAFRRERQMKILESQRPKELQFVFTEDALTINPARVAEADLLREQCDHLLYLCRLYPKLRLGVLQPGWVLNPSPNGSIVVLDFNGAAPQVAFTPGAYGPSTYVDGGSDVAAILRAFRKIQELARDHRATVEFIRRKLQEE